MQFIQVDYPISLNLLEHAFLIFLHLILSISLVIIFIIKATNRQNLLVVNNRIKMLYNDITLHFAFKFCKVKQNKYQSSIEQSELSHQICGFYLCQKEIIIKISNPAEDFLSIILSGLIKQTNSNQRLTDIAFLKIYPRQK